MTLENKNPALILAFDFGSKRIGVAIGQRVTQMARPLLTLSAKAGVPQWDKLAQLIKRWQPQELVVGIPLNMDGSEQALTQSARSFAKALKERYHLPVHEMDERLTTVAARESLFEEGGYQALQKGRVDSVAAQLILQAWLNKVKNEAEEAADDDQS